MTLDRHHPAGIQMLGTAGRGKIGKPLNVDGKAGVGVTIVRGDNHNKSGTRKRTLLLEDNRLLATPWALAFRGRAAQRHGIHCAVSEDQDLGPHSGLVFAAGRGAGVPAQSSVTHCVPVLPLATPEHLVSRWHRCALQHQTLCHTIVTILCDGGSRYASKLYNPEFLRSKNLPVPPWLTRISTIKPEFL